MIYLNEGSDPLSQEEILMASQIDPSTVADPELQNQIARDTVANYMRVDCGKYDSNSYPVSIYTEIFCKRRYDRFCKRIRG